MDTTLPLPPRLVSAHFQCSSALRCERSALLWHAVLLASWGALVAGWLPPAGFMLVGTCAFVRNFNVLHQLIHAPGVGRTPLARLQLVLSIVASPLQLSFTQAAANHRTHHAYPRDLERDPNAYLNNGPAWLALLHAFTQPEQSLGRWVRRHGFSPALAGVLVWNAAYVAALLALGGWSGLGWWLLLTRLGITTSWFIFDWVLHHEQLWGQLLPLPIPSLLLPPWRLLLGSDNLHGVQYHTLHHLYPFVPDRELPRLASLAQASMQEAQKRPNST